MSSGNRFEKTFSRKKKESKSKVNKNGDRKKKEEDNDGDQLVIGLASLPQQQLLQPKTPKKSNINGEKSASKPTISNNKKKSSASKVVDSSKAKREEQQQQSKRKDKRKAENGGGGGQNEAVKKAKTKPKTAKKEQQVKEESAECTFPTNRIVRIVKSEGSDYRLSQEAVFLINKAAVCVRKFELGFIRLKLKLCLLDILKL